MNETLNNHEYNFDMIDATKLFEIRHVERATESILQVGRAVIELSAVERIPRYNETSRENVAEHSLMLAMTANELAEQYFPDLDSGLVTKFGTVHDLVEIETGDVATFDITDSQLATKAADEHLALEIVLKRLPPATADLLRRYEAQTEPEARFVRLVDKITPYIADIYGPGRKVMEEDYGVYDLGTYYEKELVLKERFMKMFPESELGLAHQIRDRLADLFAATYPTQVSTRQPV